MPTLLHWLVLHSGQAPRLQWETASGLFLGLHLLNPPLHDTDRLLLPSPQVTEHYKTGKRLRMQTKTTLPCIITSGYKRNIFNFHEPFYQRHPIPLPYPTPANTRKHHAYMALANMSEECRIPCDRFKDMFMNPVSVSNRSVVTQFLFRTIFTLESCIAGFF